MKNVTGAKRLASSDRVPGALQVDRASELLFARQEGLL
jgi:hypothetical protein